MRLPTKHERKVAERAAAVEAGDIARIARIDVRENERCKWKAYHRSICKARANPLKQTILLRIATPVAVLLSFLAKSHSSVTF